MTLRAEMTEYIGNKLIDDVKSDYLVNDFTLVDAMIKGGDMGFKQLNNMTDDELKVEFKETFGAMDIEVLEQYMTITKYNRINAIISI